MSSVAMKICFGFLCLFISTNANSTEICKEPCKFNCLAIVAKEGLLVAGTEDGRVMIFKKDGTWKKSHVLHVGLGLSPIHAIRSHDKSNSLVVCAEHSICTFDWKSLELRGRLVVKGGIMDSCMSGDDLWTIGGKLNQLKIDNSGVVSLIRSRDAPKPIIPAICFDGKNRGLLLGHLDGSVEQMDLEFQSINKQRICERQITTILPKKGGRFVLCSGKKAVLIDDKGKTLKELTLEAGVSAAGEFDEKISFFGMTNGTLVGVNHSNEKASSIQTHKGYVNGIAFAADMGSVFNAAEDGRIVETRCDSLLKELR